MSETALIPDTFGPDDSGRGSTPGIPTASGPVASCREPGASVSSNPVASKCKPAVSSHGNVVPFSSGPDASAPTASSLGPGAEKKSGKGRNKIAKKKDGSKSVKGGSKCAKKTSGSKSAKKKGGADKKRKSVVVTEKKSKSVKKSKRAKKKNSCGASTEKSVMTTTASSHTFGASGPAASSREHGTIVTDAFEPGTSRPTASGPAASSRAPAASGSSRPEVSKLFRAGPHCGGPPSGLMSGRPRNMFRTHGTCSI